MVSIGSFQPHPYCDSSTPLLHRGMEDLIAVKALPELVNWNCVLNIYVETRRAGTEHTHI